jgi:hypothetical protein
MEHPEYTEKDKPMDVGNYLLDIGCSRILFFPALVFPAFCFIIQAIFIWREALSFGV